MTTTSAVDAWLAQVAAGTPMSPEQVRELANDASILALGMVADAVRRRHHGVRTTYLRVAMVDAGAAVSTVPAAAREVEITGAPESLSAAVTLVTQVALLAEGPRTISGFSWPDVERWTHRRGTVGDALAQLRQAGLASLASLALDGITDPEGAVGALTSAGFREIRLTIDRAPASDCTPLFLLASRLRDRFHSIQAIDPLPRVLTGFRPTTGYEDVRMVAVARLSAPNVPHIQVDWRRYGPKLAQVALAFGADDVHGVSARDEAPEGRRRAPLEEIRRNIEAAGFEPIERDGRFVAIA